MGVKVRAESREVKRPLQILLLHALSGSRRALRWASDMELLFQNNSEGTQVLAHHIDQDIPQFVKNYDFDAVFLTASSIANTIPERHYSKMMDRLSFLRDSPSVKVAFAQDDYFYSDVRDTLYVDLGIDLLYSVCPPSYWSELFPKFLDSGQTARRGFTTYVTPGLRNVTGSGAPIESRKYDVSYRTFGEGVFPNVIGSAKAELGESFARLTKGRGLSLNISNKKKDMLTGEKWLHFLGNSRATLGSPSGSSVIIRTHEVAMRARELRLHSKASTPDELEALCYRDSDRGLRITAISPRNLEAAAMGAVQVLIRDPYDGLLMPWEHYVPLESDFSNLDDVLEALRDYPMMIEIATNARAHLLSRPELQAENHVNDVLDFVSGRVEQRAKRSDRFTSSFQELAERHRKSVHTPSLRRSELRDTVSSRTPDSLLLLAAKFARGKKSST